MESKGSRGCSRNDIGICLPEKITCGFLGNLEFWGLLIITVILGMITAEAYYAAINEDDLKHPSGSFYHHGNYVRATWYIVIFVALLLPVIFNLDKASKNQKICMMIIYTLTLLYFASSSLAFYYEMYGMAIYGYAFSLISLLWLTYISSKIHAWNIAGPIIGLIWMMIVIYHVALYMIKNPVDKDIKHKTSDSTNEERASQ